MDIMIRPISDNCLKRLNEIMYPKYLACNSTANTLLL